MFTDIAAWNSWLAEPGAMLGLGLLVIAYTLAAGRFRRRLVQLGGPAPAWLPPGALSPERAGRVTAGQAAAFFAGVLVAALALLSPLHVLGEHYLFSAHMVQHLLITMVAPPLLLLGTPGWMLRPALRIGPLRRAAARVLSPISAYLLFNTIFLVWHAPALYELALWLPPLHAAEHGLFLLGALLTWWPVFGPLPEFPRLPYGAQVLYLFFQSLPPTVLGAIIALAQIPIYDSYWQAPRVSVLSPLADQQLAGLIMWIPGALGYFLVLSVVFFLWLERRSQASDPPYGRINPNRAATTHTAMPASRP